MRKRHNRRIQSSYSYDSLEARQLLACINVGGEISVDTIWDSTVDEYCLTEDIIIKNDATLTIVNTTVDDFENSDFSFFNVEQGELHTSNSIFDATLVVDVESGSTWLADQVNVRGSNSRMNIRGHVEFNNSIVKQGVVNVEPGATGQFDDNQIGAELRIWSGVSLSGIDFNNNIMGQVVGVPAASLAPFIAKNDLSTVWHVNIVGDISEDLSLVYGIGKGSIKGHATYWLDAPKIAAGATLFANLVALEFIGDVEIAGALDFSNVTTEGSVAASLQVKNGGSVHLTTQSTIDFGDIAIDQGGMFSAIDSILDVGDFQTQGTVSISGSEIRLASLELQDGATGAITNSSISSALTIDSGSTVAVTENSITSTNILTTGNPDNPVELVNNFWGTNDLDEIAFRITDQIDELTLPLLSFQPILSESGLSRILTGTEGDDRVLVFLSGDSFGISYDRIDSTFNDLFLMDRIDIDGLGGSDTLIISLYGSDDFAELFPTRASIMFGNLPIEATSFETIIIRSETGDDFVVFHDSPGDDVFTTSQDFEMSGPGFHNRAADFLDFEVTSTEGYDYAHIIAKSSNDRLVFRDGNLTVLGEQDRRSIAVGFSEYSASGQVGAQIVLWGTTGDDTFTRGIFGSVLETPDLTVEAVSFDKVTAYGNGGNDIARIADTDLDDTLFARFGEVYLSNESGFATNAFDFDSVTVISTVGGGNDKATFVGTDRPERFVGNAVFAELKDEDGFFLRAYHFANVTAISGGGADTAFLYDSEGDDTFVGSQKYNAMFNDEFRVAAIGFPEVTGTSRSGSDVVHLSDSTGDDLLVTSPTFAQMTSPAVSHLAIGFEHVFATSTMGVDRAIFRDGTGDDVFVAKPTSAIMSGEGYQNMAVGFAMTFATSNAGDDIARFVDSTGADLLFMDTQGTRLKGNGFNNFATGFRRNLVFSVGGVDSAFLSDSADNDFLGGKDDDVWMFNADYYRFVHGFESVQATALNGGVNLANVDVAFELDLLGDWI